MIMLLLKSIFGGFSMFFTNMKPLIVWVALFLSVGFCKICYTLMDVLSTLIMLRFELTNNNVLIYAVFVGILAPILSVIASIFLYRSLYAVMSSAADSSSPTETRITGKEYS
jgi:hypothetical protein